MSLINQAHEKIDYVNLVFPKAVLKAKGKLEVTRKCIKGISATRDLFDLVKPVPAVISKFCKMSKWLSILEAPFSLVDLFSNVVTLGRSTAVIEKAKAVHGSMKKSCSVAKSAAQTCKLLAFFKLVGESALSWFPVLDLISFGVSLVTLGFSCRTLALTHRIRTIVHQTDLSTHPDTPLVEKAELLRTTFTSLKNMGQETLKKQLIISQPSLKKIDSLSRKLVEKPEKREEYVAKGAAYLEKLRKHTTKNLCFSLATMAVKLAGIIATGILFFLPVTPVGIVCLSVLTFASLALWIRKDYLVDKNLLVKQKAVPATSH